MAGIDGYTKLLLHCDGADAATSFPDDSDSAHTVTAEDDAQVDTAQSKFGGASLLADGDGDYLSVPPSDDWNLGSGDFTIDCWVRFAATAKTHTICSRRADLSNWWAFYAYPNGATSEIRFRVRDNAAYVISLVPTGWVTLAVDTWYHLAVARSGSNWYLFLDGSSLTISGTPDSSGVPDLAAPFTIGDDFNHATHTYYMNGWIDEFRLSKGVARWTSSFTPATEAYSRKRAYARGRFIRPADLVPADVLVW